MTESVQPTEHSPSTFTLVGDPTAEVCVDDGCLLPARGATTTEERPAES